MTQPTTPRNMDKQVQYTHLWMLMSSIEIPKSDYYSYSNPLYCYIQKFWFILKVRTTPKILIVNCYITYFPWWSCLYWERLSVSVFGRPLSDTDFLWRSLRSGCRSYFGQVHVDKTYTDPILIGPLIGTSTDRVSPGVDKNWIWLSIIYDT